MEETATPDEFVRGALRMQAEGQGVFKIEVISYSQVPALCARCDSGEARAIQIAQVIVQFLRQIPTARPPVLCLLCDNRLSRAAPPAAIVLMTAHRDDPTLAIDNGLCPSCAGNPALETVVMARYREIMALRQLPPFCEAGRA